MNQVKILCVYKHINYKAKLILSCYSTAKLSKTNDPTDIQVYDPRTTLQFFQFSVPFSNPDLSILDSYLFL